MRIAIAGAAGFLGRAIAARLADRDVIGFDRGDAVPRADVLVWAAGQRSADPAVNRDVHVDAVAAAIRAARPARVVYLSSGECYGAAPVPFREDGPALGTSSYALAKLEGERVIGELVEVAIALRVAVAYGPGQTPTMLIMEVARALCAGQRVALTEGRQTRDFVFVDDVAGAVVAAIDRPAASATINIGSGREVAVRDVCRELAALCGGRDDLLGFGERPARPDEQARYVLDTARAADVLGWRATTPLATGLARVIASASSASATR